MERKRSPEGFLVTHQRTAGLPPHALPLQLSRPFSNYLHRCSTAQSNFFPRSPLSLPLHPRLLCRGLSCLTSPLQCRLSGSYSDTRFSKGHEWLSAGYSCVSLPRYAGCSGNQMESVWARTYEGCGIVFNQQDRLFLAWGWKQRRQKGH